MTSTRSGKFVLASTLAALIVHLLDFPAPIRIPIVLCFALLTPGVALTRTFWPPSIIERLLVTGSVSVSMLVLVSTGFVAAGLWNPTLILLTIGVVSIAGYRLVNNAPTDQEYWLAWEQRSGEGLPPLRSGRASIVQLSSVGALLSGPGLNELATQEVVLVTWMGERSLGHVEPLWGDLCTVTFQESSDGFQALVVKKCEAMAGLS